MNSSFNIGAKENGGGETGEPGNVKHQASDGQLERVSLTTNCSLAIGGEDQRPPSIRKGGTACISKSREWNGLAGSPERAAYPASPTRPKSGAPAGTGACSFLQAAS